jgi:phage-related protein
MEIQFADSSIEKFIKSLEKSTIPRVLRTLDLLERFGWNLGMPYSKKISARLFELRIRGAQEVRIFYAFQKSQVALLHGFIKKSRKTPHREIEKAIHRLATIDKI